MRTGYFGAAIAVSWPGFVLEEILGELPVMILGPG
jgi:hypothetical protein